MLLIRTWSVYEYIFVTAIDFCPLFSLQFLGSWSFTL